jgi:hypothetical protein
MGPWHEHHYRFWVLILVALALIAASHYVLFSVDSDLSKLPPDLLHSPDAILFAATFLGLLLLAVLVRSELKHSFSNSSGEPARGECIRDVHFQR